MTTDELLEKALADYGVKLARVAAMAEDRELLNPHSPEVKDAMAAADRAFLRLFDVKGILNDFK